MEEEFGNNGHDPVGEAATETAFAGAILDSKKISRPDGLLTQGMSGAQLGVLQRSMTAITKDEDYRQELKTAFFMNAYEADSVVAAINEADRYGCSRKPIVDWLIARSAGEGGARLNAIFNTISHTTFTSNYTNPSKKRWWQKDNKNGSGSSPALQS